MTAKTKEEIAKQMKLDPEHWAELYLEQQKLVDTLAQIAEDYRVRIELLMLDPDQDPKH